MKIKKGFKLCNFQIPIEMHEYLQNISNSEYMSMTQYIIQLIKQDKQNKQDKQDNISKNSEQILTKIVKGLGLKTQKSDTNIETIDYNTTNSINNIGDIDSNNILDQLDKSLNKKQLGQLGGNTIKLPNKDLEESSFFSFNRDFSSEKHQSGGGKKKPKSVLGNRKMTTYSEISFGGSSEDMLSETSELNQMARDVNNKSSEAHDVSVKKIMEILEIDESRAKAIKAILYAKVKNEHSKLSNSDKAVELLKM
jgi:hypothetical protein